MATVMHLIIRVPEPGPEIVDLIIAGLYDIEQIHDPLIERGNFLPLFARPELVQKMGLVPDLLLLLQTLHLPGQISNERILIHVPTPKLIPLGLKLPDLRLQPAPLVLRLVLHHFEHHAQVQNVITGRLFQRLQLFGQGGQLVQLLAKAEGVCQKGGELLVQRLAVGQGDEGTHAQPRQQEPACLLLNVSHNTTDYYHTNHFIELFKMGSAQTVPQHPTGKHTTDERYGGPIRLEMMNNRLTAISTISIPTKPELQQMMSLIMKRTRLHHRNLSTIRSYRVDKQADLCSESVALSMYFEYFPHDLEKDIDGRLQDGRPFTTAEVCGLLYQLADCLHYLQSHNTYHGDIKASNVLLAPRVKLLDSYFTHLGKTNLQLVLTTQTSTYLSPCQLLNLRRGDYNKREDIEKNQVFSLGMLMIEAMSLQHAYDCYEMAMLRVDETKLRGRLQELRGRYKGELVDLIQSMVEIQEENRPRFVDILKHRMIRSACTKLSMSRATSASENSSLCTNRTKGLHRNQHSQQF